jgi:hypothetical protein
MSEPKYGIGQILVEKDNITFNEILFCSPEKDVNNNWTYFVKETFLDNGDVYYSSINEGYLDEYCALQ